MSSDSSTLIRNIRKNENQLQGALVDVSRAVMACERAMGTPIPDEDDARVIWDDSIVQDTALEKALDMKVVAAGLMMPAEYRSKWGYGVATSME